MFKSYFSAWRRSFNFSTKTSRREFWNFCIIDYILLAITYFPHRAWSADIVPKVRDGVYINQLYMDIWAISGVIITLYFLVAIFPRIAIRIRRLRDIAKSWQNIFWWFIPIVGLVLEFVWLTRPSGRKRSKITFSE
tara:strand:- start:377 stop:784 length:408 start_codon:yes stop_codon:yes gene_type:complete